MNCVLRWVCILIAELLVGISPLTHRHWVCKYNCRHYFAQLYFLYVIMPLPFHASVSWRWYYSSMWSKVFMSPMWMCYVSTLWSVNLVVWLNISTALIFLGYVYKCIFPFVSFSVDTVDKSPFVVIFIKAFQYLLRAVRFLVHLAI